MARILKLSVSLPDDLVIFLDETVKERTFASRSHGIVVALERLRRAKKKETKKP